MPYFVDDKKFEINLISFLMESVEQGISVMNKELNILFMNRSACKMMDIPLSLLQKDSSLENLFRHFAERGDYGPGDIEELVDQRLTQVKKTTNLLVEHEAQNGRIVQIQESKVNDDIFVAIYTDVTEQRAYEARLEAIQYELELKLENSLKEVSYNRDLLVNAINAIDDGIILFDEYDCLVLANTRMQDLYPSLKRHLIQKSHIDKIEGFELPKPAESLEEALVRGSRRNEVKLKNDHWYRIEQSATVNGGKIAIFSDISTYKEQTTKLQQHTNELVKLLQKEISLSETQREFVTMASHEFKTPLAIIDSNAQRIERKAGELSQDRLLQRISNIRESVERMQYLINRFMDFSSEEIAGLKMEAKKQNFRSTIERLCMTHQEMTGNFNIHWDLQALPEFANFDQNLLDQCVSNILSNAVKYSDEGAPIHIMGIRDDRNIKIEICDEGIGIPKEELGKIFNKYYRASNSSGKAGTGIGLNFTQMALKEQGGHLEVESTLGKGSCFTIFLPLSITEEKAPKQSSAVTDETISGKIAS
ncbi:PAS-domain containing protein [uncultured Cohaesibacter sp.]|uniref:sensor histidine kinase n=1 Tax=uncultured Cohaesibacter sp. TaxID=1002546 RepID=UPI00292D0E08|nr:PAS-domain containing protein [uncultured Cohaesibacter sp.]